MRNVEDLIADLADEGVPKARPRTPGLMFAVWLGGFIAYIAFLLVFFNPRPDLMHKMSEPLFAAEIGTLLLVLMTTAWSAALLSFPDLHQKKSMLLLPPIAAALFVAVMAAAWIADNPPAPLPAHEMDCLICITLMAVIPAFGMMYQMRKMATTRPMVSGAACCLAAFSIGALTLRLSEPTDSIRHVIHAHYLPMVIVALIGLMIGKKIFKW